MINTSVVVVCILSSIGRAVWLMKKGKRYYESVWFPLNKSQTHDVFRAYIEKNSKPAEESGYVPVGVHLVKEMISGPVESASLLHPEGHSLIHITHASPKFAIEIQSFLDDGSVIESCNVDISRSFSELAPHGFLVNIYPKVTVEELIAAHDCLVQAVLTDPGVGLRKLTVENWRQYALYASRHFDQIKFDLGKLRNGPKPFVFPNGELVSESSITPILGHSGSSPPTTVTPSSFETA